MGPSPGFLDLPHRTEKPRTHGLTHVLDKGLTIGALEALLHQSDQYVDILKLGWGIGYLVSDLAERVLLCQRHDVALCLGGTLVEIAAAQGRVDDLVAWSVSNGVRAVEVSNGLAAMARSDKTALVRRLSRDFVVLAETGAKDDRAHVSGREWAEEMESDLDAGASLVIAEGRESGTVGLYRPDGTPRTDVVDDVLGRVPLDKLIFEAPRKAQQTWFISRFGADVNLGNVGADEVLALETLRLGLRADTALPAIPDPLTVAAGATP